MPENGLPAMLDGLQAIVGRENVLTSATDCLGYSRDMSIHVGLPEAVVFAESAEQVSRVLALANQAGLPVTVRGGGTSVTGASLPVKGGLVLNLVRMNRIREINRADGYAVVEPGVICQELNKALSPGHFYPPDPGSAPIATIGGMVSTNASGVRAVKYGTARDYVKAMEVVLADGRIIRTGSKAPKSSAGYDLNRLFATSEGTLGVITELTLRILPVPEYSIFAKLSFPSIVEAGATVEEIMRRGVPISTCEILDGVSIETVRKAMGLEIPAGVTCLLFMEIDGHRGSVESAAAQVDVIMKENGGLESEWSDDPVKRAAIWSARHGLVTSLSRIRPGQRQVPITEDFGVPMSRIPETIADIQAIGRKHGVEIATFGHIGDGNLHAVLLMDVRNQEHWETTRRIADDFIELTLKHEGTLTAEHGVGLAKSPFIARELGESLEVMASIKKALDPKNILNPGKLGFADSIRDIYEMNACGTLREGVSGDLSFGEELDREILSCVQCGFCTLGCPTFGVSQIETMNARGRNNLAFNLLTGKVRPSAEMAERLYQCTLCDNCKSTCPAGVRTSAIVQAARGRLYEAGLSPEIFNLAYRSIRENGNPFLEPRAKRTDVFPAGIPAEPEAEVLYWAGCLSSYQEMKVVPATVKALEAAGVKWTALGQEEGCCGYLAYLTGAMDRFKELAEQNIKAFESVGARTVLTTCPGCYKAFRDLYPEQTGKEVRVMHASEYFGGLAAEGRLPWREEAKALRAVYHDPCDLGRHMGVYEPPRELLRRLPGLELKEFPLNREMAKCCGAGGGMKGFDLDLSLELAERRVLSAVETGAEAIVSACPSCKQNFNQAAAKLKKDGRLQSKVKVYDLMELLAQRLA